MKRKILTVKESSLPNVISLKSVIVAAVALSPRLSLPFVRFAFLLPFVRLAFLDQRHSSSSNAFTCRTKFMVCSV